MHVTTVNSRPLKFRQKQWPRQLKKQQRLHQRRQIQMLKKQYPERPQKEQETRLWLLWEDLRCLLLLLLLFKRRAPSLSPFQPQKWKTKK